MLEKLIQILLLDRHLLITVKEEEEIQSYPIYLLHLYKEKSHWIIEGFDLKEEKKLLFPVDDLINIEPYTTKKRLNKKKILEKLSKKYKIINLVLELGPKAIAQFKNTTLSKFQYLTQTLTNPQPF